MTEILEKQERTLTPPTSLKAKVIPMKSDDQVHSMAFGYLLTTHIKAEAEAHKAHFDDQAFKNILSLIQNEKLRAYFLAVSVDEKIPEIAGSTIELPTVLTRWEKNAFVHYPAVYGEDLFVSPEFSRAFQATLHNDESMRTRSLGAFFTQEKYRMSASGESQDAAPSVSARGMVLEYAVNNAPIERLLNRMKGTFDRTSDSAILQFEDMPACFRKKKNAIDFSVDSLGCVQNQMATVQPHVFVVSAESRETRQSLSASFTESVSTFSGKPVIRVQITSNGKMKESTPWIKDSLITIFTEAKKEISKRSWFSWVNPKPKDLCEFIKIMKIHALNESAVSTTLKDMGAKPRKLGPRIMKPMIIDFKNVPQDIMPGQKQVQPLTVIRNYSSPHRDPNSLYGGFTDILAMNA